MCENCKVEIDRLLKNLNSIGFTMKKYPLVKFKFPNISKAKLSEQKLDIFLENSTINFGLNMKKWRLSVLIIELN
ncbi:hypothetical protein BpHYR1_010097 [Brachionus plicatilis]|uniref:Uncharacterized protein n=1 Tax=Brachionus plicatilis TaxID=10195 RepID=A0A3M7QSF9_BRAPC|nr:hypothetical protein BpHYR1_010097 [Brachionus plicatilis]